ncbi:MAG: hypothetical protein E6X23_20725 [Mixta calida]|uniref:hypothetical protein n=1 Tax=Mixta calida TaxID=665913 RepID=UPI00290E3D7B|nr:hypothetical protein [Mixta calida]MDU4943929.1 hypothetical protein [Mixta calida]
MTNNDELERQKMREQFSVSFEDHTGWHPDDYPSPDIVETCWECWKDGWIARSEQEQSDE